MTVKGLPAIYKIMLSLVYNLIYKKILNSVETALLKLPDMKASKWWFLFTPLGKF